MAYTMGESADVRVMFGMGQQVCCTPRSRHPKTNVRFSKKNVGLALNSGRNCVVQFTGCSYDTISQFFSREASLLRNQELEQI